MLSRKCNYFISRNVACNVKHMFVYVDSNASQKSASECTYGIKMWVSRNFFAAVCEFFMQQKNKC